MSQASSSEGAFHINLNFICFFFHNVTIVTMGASIRCTLIAILSRFIRLLWFYLEVPIMIAERRRSFLLFAGADE